MSFLTLLCLNKLYYNLLNHKSNESSTIISKSYNFKVLYNQVHTLALKRQKSIRVLQPWLPGRRVREVASLNHRDLFI